MFKKKKEAKHSEMKGKQVLEESRPATHFVGNKSNKSIYTSNAIRKKQLMQANEEEDKTIKRLEKMLKLNKKKKKGKKKIPSSFMDDGLDYLLEVIDGKDGDRILSDDSVDFEGDLLASKGQSGSCNKRKFADNSDMKPKKQRTLTELLVEKEGEVTESETDDISSCDEKECDLDKNSAHCADDYKEDSENESENFNESDNSPEKVKKPQIWEDIYGRLRDESGNVIKSTAGKELPADIAENQKNLPGAQKQEELLKIKRKLKGLLNRLSESNMQPIANQIEEMYMRNSRNDMNDTLFTLISEFVLTSISTPPRLIMEQAMLIALLHANIGPEIGAFFLQHLIQKLNNLFKSSENYGEGKECNNILIFLSHLYNFKVTHSTLMFDIFGQLYASFQNKDIELIQLLLKNVGFVLRKDDPLHLKETILGIQAKAAGIQKDHIDSRILFMLDTLTAIRNNNMYKIPDYDPSIIEHSKKVLKGLVHKGCSVQELVISFEDLLKAEERGRWWIVGSAWSERDNPSVTNTNPSQNNISLKTHISEKILQLAQKQHMNTEIRKSIFCVIMTAEDFMDAFRKLLKLNIKNQQEREIINVILHCVLQEKIFNPYYAYLAGMFCSFARKYQMSLQYSLWDKFKELSKMKSNKINNLAHFLSHLFISSALPLSVLKVIHFSDMNKIMVSFFRQILLAILLHESEAICCQVFKRISAAKNLNLLREGLRLFMHHFILRNQSKFEPGVGEKLSERVKLVENVLNSSKRAFKL